MQKDLQLLLKPKEFDEVSLNSLNIGGAPKVDKMKLERLVPILYKFKIEP
jgi:hypothetical protein